MSNHLDHIIGKQHGSTNANVVFLDVVKYSMRKSIVQQGVIQDFNRVLSKALESVSAKHIAISQKQQLNLAEDIIKIPTGDGAAIVFPFQGLQNIHLDFALEFLSHSVASRKDITCNVFDENGWCNCHKFFDVRIGVSDGKVIIFKDINGSYNIAGGTINMANRVMGLADRQQIIFTKDAYNNIIDMTEDTSLEARFTAHGNLHIKHDLHIDVYQYVGHGENLLNKEFPIQISILMKENMLRNSNPIFGSDRPKSPVEKLKQLEVMEILKDLPIPAGMSNLFGNTNTELNTETARALVSAFKVVDQLMKPGFQEKIIVTTHPPHACSGGLHNSFSGQRGP